MQPDLDRFAWKGPHEIQLRDPLTETQRFGVKVLLTPPECEVCGQEAHPVFLRMWNGKEVCKYCINEIEREAEHIEHHIEY